LSKLEVLEKIKQISPAQFYVWDGQDLDDKPLTQEQLSKAIKGRC
jgi:adenylosuccinate synthase